MSLELSQPNKHLARFLHSKEERLKLQNWHSKVWLVLREGVVIAGSLKSSPKLLCSANRIIAGRWGREHNTVFWCLNFQGTVSSVGYRGGVSGHFSNYFVLMEMKQFYQVTTEYWTYCWLLLLLQPLSERCFGVKLEKQSLSVWTVKGINLMKFV